MEMIHVMNVGVRGRRVVVYTVQAVGCPKKPLSLLGVRGHVPVQIPALHLAPGSKSLTFSSGTGDKTSNPWVGMY